MTLQDLSPQAQDYLKMIWDLREWGHGAVQPSALAYRAHVRASTVSGAVSRLVAGGYARHTPYGTIALTERGERYAVRMARKHRLLEMFLVTTLGYRWDEVHPEADALEHAASDLMIDRIDELLGHPDADPHGDPIPRADGSLPTQAAITLVDLPDGVPARIVRVNDVEPTLLHRLEHHGAGLHAVIAVSRPQEDDAATSGGHADRSGDEGPIMHIVALNTGDGSPDTAPCTITDPPDPPTPPTASRSTPPRPHASVCCHCATSGPSAAARRQPTSHGPERPGIHTPPDPPFSHLSGSL